MKTKTIELSQMSKMKHIPIDTLAKLQMEYEFNNVSRQDALNEFGRLWPKVLYVDAVKILKGHCAIFAHYGKCMVVLTDLSPRVN